MVNIKKLLIAVGVATALSVGLCKAGKSIYNYSIYREDMSNITEEDFNGLDQRDRKQIFSNLKETSENPKEYKKITKETNLLLNKIQSIPPRLKLAGDYIKQGEYTKAQNIINSIESDIKRFQSNSVFPYTITSLKGQLDLLSTDLDNAILQGKNN